MDKENKIGFDTYQEEAFRLVSEEGRKNPVLNGVLGLGGESGECIDLVKKHLFQGHDLNKDDLVKELGDVLWYIAETASGLGVSLSEVARINLEKLHKRYGGDRFSAEKSRHRSDEN